MDELDRAVPETTEIFEQYDEFSVGLERQCEESAISIAKMNINSEVSMEPVETSNCIFINISERINNTETFTINNNVSLELNSSTNSSADSEMSDYEIDFGDYYYQEDLVPSSDESSNCTSDVSTAAVKCYSIPDVSSTMVGNGIQNVWASKDFLCSSETSETITNNPWIFGNYLKSSGSDTSKFPIMAKCRGSNYEVLTAAVKSCSDPIMFEKSQDVRDSKDVPCSSETSGNDTNNPCQLFKTFISDTSEFSITEKYQGRYLEAAQGNVNESKRCLDLDFFFDNMDSVSKSSGPAAKFKDSEIETSVSFPVTSCNVPCAKIGLSRCNSKETRDEKLFKCMAASVKEFINDIEIRRSKLYIDLGPNTYHSSQDFYDYDADIGTTEFPISIGSESCYGTANFTESKQEIIEMDSLARLYLGHPQQIVQQELNKPQCTNTSREATPRVDENSDNDKASSSASDKTSDNELDLLSTVFKTEMKYYPINKFEIPSNEFNKDRRTLHAVRRTMLNSYKKLSVQGTEREEIRLEDVSNFGSDSVMVFDTCDDFSEMCNTNCELLRKFYLEKATKVNLLLMKRINNLSPEEHEIRLGKIQSLNNELEDLINILSFIQVEWRELICDMQQKLKSEKYSKLRSRCLYYIGRLRICLDLTKTLLKFSREMKDRLLQNESILHREYHN